MGLRLIYGRAGSGKSKYCFDQIKENINSNSPIYIITPEQFSFTAEQKLLETISMCKDHLSHCSVINAEVITFNRMADRIFNEVGGVNNTHISKAGKSMLISSILKKQKKNLKFLGNTDEFTDVILRTFKDFKKHNVTLDFLEETMKVIDNKYLESKLNDINLIYTLYEEKLENRYIDDDDVLTILSEKLEKSEMFKNSIIYIDEFAGFTKQEYMLITELLKVANQINITVCTDTLEEPQFIDTDIFYSNKVTAKRLIECAKNANVKILEPIKLEGSNRFKSEELKHLEENLYNINYKKYSKDNNDITLFLATNSYSEIEYVAQNIIKLVRNEKLRYRDISIITKDINTYSSLIKAIFQKYNIPVFIDDEKDLGQNVLIKYILSILDIFSNNWSYESMFNYIKTGFLELEKDDIFELENYCIKYGIKGKKWYEDDFKYGEEEQIKKLNEIRLKIVTPLIELKNSISKSKTVKQISQELYLFLVKNKVFETLNKKIDYLQTINEIDMANEYTSSVNLVINLLDEIVSLFQDEIISFENYRDLLKIGFSSSSLKNIPATLDQVIVGDIDRSRSHKVRAIFIIGLNDRSISKCK